jgi:hypothetical protein
MSNVLNVVLGYALVWAILLVGFDLVTRPMPWANKLYRKGLKWVGKNGRTQGWRFISWLWRLVWSWVVAAFRYIRPRIRPAFRTFWRWLHT